MCSCGLKNSRKVSGAPWGSASRRGSAGLGESGARWLRPAALSASLSGSGRKTGGLSGDDPSRPAGGLCWSGTPPASCAYCHCSICRQTHTSALLGNKVKITFAYHKTLSMEVR